MTKQFKQRLLLGGLGIVGFGISISCSHLPFFKPVFILLTIVVISLALGEYYHLTRNKGFQPSDISGIGVSVIYAIALAISFYDSSLNALPSLVLLISLVILFLVFFKQHTSALGNLAITLFGVIYLTLPICCGLRINYFFPESALNDGRLWLAYVILVTKITDIGAYFCGKIFGKTKLAPIISPKKTIEGAFGGLSIALISSMLFAFIASHFAVFNMTFFQSIWIGLSISILAQLGDLSESLLKRDAGVKDSSQLPGLGGMLDVVDSLVFTLPLMYLLLKMQIVN